MGFTFFMTGKQFKSKVVLPFFIQVSSCSSECMKHGGESSLALKRNSKNVSVNTLIRRRASYMKYSARCSIPPQISGSVYSKRLRSCQPFLVFPYSIAKNKVSFYFKNITSYSYDWKKKIIVYKAYYGFFQLTCFM